MYFLNDDTLKIEFDETNPPYNRDIIEKKIKAIHKLLGTKNIFLENIDKEKSFFRSYGLLLTPIELNPHFYQYIHSILN